MSNAERSRAYRLRKEKFASWTVGATKSSFALFVQERTDAELQEALRQAMTDVRRNPNRKRPRERVAQIVAEFARRYPLA